MVVNFDCIRVEGFKFSVSSAVGAILYLRHHNFPKFNLTEKRNPNKFSVVDSDFRSVITSAEILILGSHQLKKALRCGVLTTHAQKSDKVSHAYSPLFILLKLRWAAKLSIFV